MSPGAGGKDRPVTQDLPVCPQDPRLDLPAKSQGMSKPTAPEPLEAWRGPAGPHRATAAREGVGGPQAYAGRGRVLPGPAGISQLCVSGRKQHVLREAPARRGGPEKASELTTHPDSLLKPTACGREGHSGATVPSVHSLPGPFKARTLRWLCTLSGLAKWWPRWPVPTAVSGLASCLRRSVVPQVHSSRPLTRRTPERPRKVVTHTLPCRCGLPLPCSTSRPPWAPGDSTRPVSPVRPRDSPSASPCPRECVAALREKHPGWGWPLLTKCPRQPVLGRSPGPCPLSVPRCDPLLTPWPPISSGALGTARWVGPRPSSVRDG